MNKIFPLVFLLLIVTILQSQTIDFNQLEERNNYLSYKKGENKAFSGTAIKYYSQNKPEYSIEYIDGLEHGKAIYYNPLGNIICEGIFKEGIEHDKWKWYYPNKKTKTVGNYNIGTPIGIWEYFRENGTIDRSGSIENGKENGLWKYWNEKGILSTTREYKVGIKDGIETWYYESGNIMLTRTYFNGIENGLFAGWFDSGEKQFEGNARNGKVIRYIEWDKKGIAIKINKYED